MITLTYDYPQDGGCADTVATLYDGRKLWINTQYKQVLARHADGCAKGHCSDSAPNVCAEGARRAAAQCTCGSLDNIIETDVLADAAINGKFGARPIKRSAPAATEPVVHGFGWCNKCHSYCYGDCEAS